MAQHHQQLIVSAWLPLGINNLLDSSESVRSYLDAKQQELKLIDWDGQVQVYDLYLTFTLHFNSPYDYGEEGPDTLTVQVRYFGWGYITFSLISDKHSSKNSPLDPALTNSVMRFLLEKSREIITGTLLPHQHNYLANVLVSSQKEVGGLLRAEEYLRAALEGQLENGIMDGASREDIKQAFRFEARTASEESCIPRRRNYDLLVKTLVLKRNACLEPWTYDSVDRDFSEHPQTCEDQQYLRGQHRSSLLMWDSAPPAKELVDLVCASNALTRSSRYLLQTMVSARQQLSFVRMALLEHRLRVTFEHDIPEVIKVPEAQVGEEVSEHLAHLQGYVLYLLSRIPLLQELVKYTIEAQGKLESWHTRLLPWRSLKEAKAHTQGYDEVFLEELYELWEYVNDLVRTVVRVQEGLDDEIDSVSRLIQIYDEEQSLALLSVLPEIEGLQSETMTLTERQETIQKRALESQFIQSELTRASEARAKTRGVLAQAGGAVAFSGLINTTLGSLILGIATAVSPTSAIDKSPWFTIGLPLASMVIGWLAAGGLVSRAGRYQDMIEVVFPLEAQEPKRVGESVCAFDESDLLALEAEKRFHRIRIEANIHRVTWEDQVEITVTRRRFRIWNRTTRKLVDALITLEYQREAEACLPMSIMVSMERSREYGKNIKELQEEVIETASKRLHAIIKTCSIGEWTSLLEQSTRGKPMTG